MFDLTTIDWEEMQEAVDAFNITCENIELSWEDDTIEDEVELCTLENLNETMEKVTTMVITKDQCECGGERLYGKDTSLHSTWCRKYSG